MELQVQWVVCVEIPLLGRHFHLVDHPAEVAKELTRHILRDDPARQAKQRSADVVDLARFLEGEFLNE